MWPPKKPRFGGAFFCGSITRSGGQYEAFPSERSGSLAGRGIAGDEARVVVMEASQLRAQASRAADWLESGLEPACGSVPISWRLASWIHSGAPLPRAPCRSRHDPREAEEGRGLL